METAKVLMIMGCGLLYNILYNASPKRKEYDGGDGDGTNVQFELK